MAVALTFGTVILQSHWGGDAVCVGSDLNGFGEVAEAWMLYFSVWYGSYCQGVATGGVFCKKKRIFFKQFKKPLIVFCNAQELMP